MPGIKKRQDSGLEPDKINNASEKVYDVIKESSKLGSDNDSQRVVLLVDQASSI